MLSPLLSSIALTALLACRGSQTPLTQRQKQVSDDLKSAVDQYLTDNIVKPNFGGRVFCAHKPLAVEEQGVVVNEHVFAVCQEYKRSGGELNEGTGTAIPVALKVERRGGASPIITHEVPGDSPMYADDVKRIFPDRTHDEILYGRREAILSEVKEKAKLYFDRD